MEKKNVHSRTFQLGQWGSVHVCACVRLSLFIEVPTSDRDVKCSQMLASLVFVNPLSFTYHAPFLGLIKDRTEPLATL